MAQSGIFKAANPHKYRGNFNNIVYRSSWEFRFFRYLDSNPNVLEWASEEISIPYKSVDRKIHRYYPDVWMRIKDAEGNEVQYLVEIKPMYQTEKPLLEQFKSKTTYKKAAIRYAINKAKWAAAEDYCAKRNWKFVIMTEKELALGTYGK